MTGPKFSHMVFRKHATGDDGTHEILWTSPFGLPQPIPTIGHRIRHRSVPGVWRVADVHHAWESASAHGVEFEGSSFCWAIVVYLTPDEDAQA